MRSRINLLVPVIALILGVVLIVAGGLHAQTVRISYAGISGYNVPLWVADEAGLFKKYKLPVTLPP
jgi:ABC-type nitrate/sulfonate/bicarbonate transport system substrate-binding protein